MRAPVRAPTASARQSNLEANMRWLIDPPKNSDSDTLKRTRLSVVADVVVCAPVAGAEVSWLSTARSVCASF